MYDKTRAGTVSCRDDPQQSSRKSPKVTKGKIVPASVLESKKQRPNKFSLSCVKSFFDKRLKGLSPRDCFPPVGSAAAGKAAGKNTRKKFHMTPNVSGDKCMEIYESEFDNIELRAFSTINKDDFFNLSDKESLETAIGLDVNNAVRSYRSPFKQPKVMPNTNNIYLPAATQIDQTVQPGTPSFALLFGDENYFDENIQSRHLSSSSSSRQNSTTGNNSPTATASWKPSTTTPLNEYVDEDELSRSFEFSLDTNSVSHTLSSAYSHSPYQNIDYSNSIRSDRPSHQHSDSQSDRYILDKVIELVKLTTDYFNDDDKPISLQVPSPDYANSLATITNSCHLSTKSLTSSSSSTLEFASSRSSSSSADTIEMSTDLSELSFQIPNVLIRQETDEWISTSF